MAVLIPVKKAAESLTDLKRDDYKIENVYALFTLCVTDKTFGELIININELRGLPECKMIREVQHRVQIVPTEENTRSQQFAEQKLLKK